MGVVCCNKLSTERKTDELSLLADTGAGSSQTDAALARGAGEPGAKPLGRSKTMVKKEQKKYVMPKTESDAVLITASQFVVEVQGIFSNSYQFTRQLGQGSYGTVYQSIHKKTGEKRAIKLINKSAVPAQNELQLFNEIKVLKEMVGSDAPVTVRRTIPT